jgi:hypothetical protein
MSDRLDLAFGLSFADLHAREGLVRLDRAFVDWLQAHDVGLANRLLAARAAPEALAPLDESGLIVDLGPALERFVGVLFGVGAELGALADATRSLDPIWEAKRGFVQRRALKAHKPEAAAAFDAPALAAAFEAAAGEALTEASFARHVLRWSADEGAHAPALAAAERYAAWATLTPAGRAKHAAGVLFRAPSRWSASSGTASR